MVPSSVWFSASSRERAEETSQSKLTHYPAVTPAATAMPAGDPPLTILVRDGKRLAETLERHHPGSDAYNSAALKIRTAMLPGGGSDVERFAIGGEDAAAIAALEELQQSGDFRDPLPRLLSELKTKIERESV